MHFWHNRIPGISLIATAMIFHALICAIQAKLQVALIATPI